MTSKKVIAFKTGTLNNEWEVKIIMNLSCIILVLSLIGSHANNSIEIGVKMTSEKLLRLNNE